MRKSTMVELVSELEKLKEQNPNFSSQLDFMIVEAKAGEYHDYKNKKYPCGKLEASCKLRALGFIFLARCIEQGEFDEEE